MNRRWMLAITVVISGCHDAGDPHSTDQCMRQALFTRCLATGPRGPESVHYNDSAEVIEACDSVARFQSARREQFIAPECRP